MKIVTGTQEQMKALENEMFSYGAPFSAYITGDEWNEEIKGVYGRRNGKVNYETGITYAWQSLQTIDEEGDVYGIVHIDMFNFAPYTHQQYLDMLPIIPEAPEGEDPTDPADYLNPNELAIKKRVEALDEQYLEYTPQKYVSEVLIGDKYLIIEK